MHDIRVAEKTPRHVFVQIGWAGTSRALTASVTRTTTGRRGATRGQKANDAQGNCVPHLASRRLQLKARKATCLVGYSRIARFTACRIPRPAIGG